MKKLIIATFLVSATFMAHSQVNPSKGDLKFSAGAELGLPIGDFADASTFGFGLSVQADYYIFDKLSLNLNVGVLSYQGKSQNLLGNSVKLPNLTIIPVVAGTKYWITDKFYGSAQLGLSFLSYNGVNSRDFTYAPGIGYQFTKMDVQLKYNSINTDGGSLDNIGLRVAYHF